MKSENEKVYEMSMERFRKAFPELAADTSLDGHAFDDPEYIVRLTMNNGLIDKIETGFASDPEWIIRK